MAWSLGTMFTLLLIRATGRKGEFAGSKINLTTVLSTVRNEDSRMDY